MFIDILFCCLCVSAFYPTLAHSRVKREETFGIKVSAQVNSAAEAFADFLFFVVQPNSRRATNVVYHNTHNTTESTHVWKSATFYLYYSLDFYFTIL
jgi:hypothetical protein